MLSVSAISSAGKAEYYAKDDYYIGQPVTPEDTQLEWGGKGAERLQLEGVAKADDFKQVMGGRNPDPDGAPLSKLEKVEREAATTGASPSPAASHRPGADLTFSAPKGVSVALLVGGDVRLTVAHREAVAEAMGYAEVHLAHARLRNGKGERSVVQTGNLVYAATTHSSSREGDPQLHSHVVVANATYVEQVKDWRALEPKALFANQVLLGQIYRAALAERVQTLGYDIRQHRSGTFELAAFSAAQLAAFSKATERVAKNLAEAQPETGAAKDVVKRLNRPRKLEVAPDQLLARWEREAAAAGFSPKEVVAGAERALVGRDVTDRREGRVGLIDSELARITTAIGDRLAPRRDPYGFSRGERLEGQDLAARAAVSYGLQVNESQRAVFTRHDVLARALEASPATTAARLERQLDALVEDSRVRVADATVLSGVTTATSLGVEAEIVERMRRGLGAGRALFGVEAGLKRVSPDAVLRAGHAHAMNAGQTAAAALILTSADRVIAVHGAAGVGKTTLFEVVVRAAEEKGLSFFGVTPSHSAKANLAEKADTEAAVLAWMTARYGRLAQPGARATAEERREWKGRGLIVDEASMMSNTDAQSLLRIADALKIEKVVLVGDMRQHNSPGAGAPFRHLINEEVPLARVEQIMRQKDPQLHHIVSTLARGEGVNGLRLLGDRVVEVGRGEGDSALAQAAYALWSEGKEAGRSRPIIVQTQAQRSLVSELIVNNLVERGEAVPVGVTSERLVAVQMHGPQRLDAGAYKVGQVLVFHAASRTAGVARGAHLKITGIDDRGRVNLLSARDEGGRPVTVDLNRTARAAHLPFQVYESREGAEVHLGADLVWERSDDKRGFYTGETFTPVADKGDQLQVRLASGALVDVAKSDPHLRFVGPGYAMTSHRSQSLTLEVAPIGVMASRCGDVATLYVQASRGVHDFSLVTDDRALLIQRLGQETGMNLIAAEELAATREKEAEAHTRAPADRDDEKIEPAHEDREHDASDHLWSPDDPPEDLSQRRAPLNKRLEIDLPISFPDHSL